MLGQLSLCNLRYKYLFLVYYLFLHLFFFFYQLASVLLNGPFYLVCFQLLAYYKDFIYLFFYVKSPANVGLKLTTHDQESHDRLSHLVAPQLFAIINYTALSTNLHCVSKSRLNS